MQADNELARTTQKRRRIVNQWMPCSRMITRMSHAQWCQNRQWQHKGSSNRPQWG